MTISIPDTFSADLSGKYIMSIRLCTDGLSFSAYNPEKAQSFFYREVVFDRGTPYLALLGDLFFENEIFTQTYKRVNVFFVTPQYTLAPDEMLPDERKTDLFSFNFSTPAKRILCNPVKENCNVVFGVDEEVYDFCSRSLSDPVYYHHITPQLQVLTTQIQSEKQNHLFVTAHREVVDIIGFKEDRLVFVNTFDYQQSDDLLYYILYVWQQLEMNQLTDRLSFSGRNTALCNKGYLSLQNYVQHVGKTEIPSEAYLIGGEILQAPLDLILQTVCE